MPKSTTDEPIAARFIRSLFITTVSELFSLILRLYLAEAKHSGQSSPLLSVRRSRRRFVAPDEEQEEEEEVEDSEEREDLTD